MGHAYTRAEMRDWVRARLGITPPIAQPINSQLFGPAGTEPKDRPNPNNFLINSAIDEALSTINTRTGFHAYHFDLTVPATSLTQGAQQIQLNLNTTDVTNAAVVNQSVGLQNINSLRRVLWMDASQTQPNFLTPSPYRVSDLALIQFDSMPPAIPTNYFVEGYSIYLYPASVNGGTLTLWVGTGLMQPIGDTNTIDQLPSDYFPDVLYNVMVTIAESRVLNAEMMQIAASYSGKAEAGIENIGAWQNQAESPKEQSSMGFLSNRTAYGLRRRRR